MAWCLVVIIFGGVSVVELLGEAREQGCDESSWDLVLVLCSTSSLPHPSLHPPLQQHDVILNEYFYLVKISTLEVADLRHRKS